jgi:hypothetical protein
MGEMDRNPLLDPQPPDVLTDAMQEYGERGRFTPFGYHHSMVGYRRHRV